MGRKSILTFKEIQQTLERILGKVIVLNSQAGVSKQKKDESQKILTYCIKMVTEETSEQTINRLVVQEFKKRKATLKDKKD